MGIGGGAGLPLCPPLAVELRQLVRVKVLAHDIVSCVMHTRRSCLINTFGAKVTRFVGCNDAFGVAPERI